MDETGLVDRLEPRKKLRGDVLGLLQFEGTTILEHLEQRAAVDILHRYKLEAVDLDQIEDPADVGRNHLAGGADLGSQRLAPAPIGKELWSQTFEGYLDPQLEVVGVPHLALPAAAEEGSNLITVAKDTTRLELQPPVDLAAASVGRLRRRIMVTRYVLRHGFPWFSFGGSLTTRSQSRVATPRLSNAFSALPGRG